MSSRERLLHVTTSLCRECRVAVEARVVAAPGEGSAQEVWLVKRCVEHGPQRVRLSTSAAWYERTRAIRPIDAPRAAAGVAH